MAYGTRRTDGGSTIKTFQPDDTTDTLHSDSWGYKTLEDIRKMIEAKWPGIREDEVHFQAKHIQTDCIGYDRYDPLDHTDFIVITAEKSYFDRMKKAEESPSAA